MDASVRKLLQMSVTGTGEPVFRARARLSSLLRRLRFPRETADGVLLAFSEALSNAILYGARGQGSVRVDVGLDGDRLIVEVSDQGGGFHPRAIQLPPLDAMTEGGRGLFLMRAFMDDVVWQDNNHGTTVRMTKIRAT